MNDQDILELWHERAAIREFDGRTDTLRAEFLGAKDTQRLLGLPAVPECVAVAVSESKRKAAARQERMW